MSGSSKFIVVLVAVLVLYLAARGRLAPTVKAITS